MVKICALRADMIFDSRGEPAVRVIAELSDGAIGIGSVPSGASTGTHEAHELRDGGEAYGGRGVLRAIGNVNTLIADAVCGLSATDQWLVDDCMITLDGTENKKKLGANAILAVSWAVAAAAAESMHQPLYRFLGGINGREMPCPMMNVINGGKHAGNNLDIQEFMIVPCGAENFREAMRMGTECYRSLGTILKERGFSTSVGDEGGYAPDLRGDEEALELLVQAIEHAGWRAGEDVCIAIDFAASEWADDEGYLRPKSRERFSTGALIEYYSALASKYPIISMEDPLGEEDFDGFRRLTEKMGEDVMIVGDDLFVTDPTRILRGAAMDAANAVLIKPNQIGTVSETMESIRTASDSGYATIISHRSGETESTAIADLAVAVNSPFIKAGAPARSERLAKYNRLLMIENELNM